jgi:hypothetical protein
VFAEQKSDPLAVTLPKPFGKIHGVIFSDLKFISAHWLLKGTTVHR